MEWKHLWNGLEWNWNGFGTFYFWLENVWNKAQHLYFTLETFLFQVIFGTKWINIDRTSFRCHLDKLTASDVNLTAVRLRFILDQEIRQHACKSRAQAKMMRCALYFVILVYSSINIVLYTCLSFPCCASLLTGYGPTFLRSTYHLINERAATTCDVLGIIGISFSSSTTI